jgi:hypothetical protein
MYSPHHRVSLTLAGLALALTACGSTPDGRGTSATGNGSTRTGE